MLIVRCRSPRVRPPVSRAAQPGAMRSLGKLLAGCAGMSGLGLLVAVAVVHFGYEVEGAWEA